ncbi:phosphoribosylformylglycinamidine synthase-associated small membrane protein [uncultured Cohaesibacter sp.]|uniref:phosphoribosylformylglycinamidine synthase-associated small membrane protein n=1 Tax=uncultured Cohaesibacter sp. TaxID=1002546 RepID=UPI00292FE920|nr:phosphoribosylformylglycinamidine synthase-associated small membrane protein [uncultured Cohaesibacter sp.]
MSGPEKGNDGEPMAIIAETPSQSTFNQKEEAAKALRFMAIKAAIFILIPVVASALAVIFLM